MTTKTSIPHLTLRVDTQKLVGEGAWAAIGQIGAAIGTLVGLRLMTELVPPDMFGTVSLLTGISLFGSNLLCMPIYQAMQRIFADASRKGFVADLRKVSIGLLRPAVWVLMIGLALIGLSRQQVVPGSLVTFLLMAALVPLEAMRAFEITLLGAARRQQPYGLWSAFEAWMRPMMAVALIAVTEASTATILAGYILATGAGLLLFRSVITPEGATAKQALGSDGESQLRQEIIQFAWPLAPLAVTAWANSQGDRYIVGGFMGLEWAGIYVATYGLVSRPFIMLGTIVAQTLKPLYFMAAADGQQARAAQVLKCWLAIMALSGITGALAVWLLRSQIAGWLLAEKFRAGADLMPWIAAGYGLQMVVTVLESVFYARRHTRRLAFAQTVAAAASLLAAWGGSQWGGLRGVAMACPVSFGIQILILSLCTRRSDA